MCSKPFTDSNPEPWYGVRLIYQHIGVADKAFEERILIVCAESGDEAIASAEAISSATYEDENCSYTGYAMAFHIFDERGDALPEGTEVFSLLRKSELPVNEYLDRYFDTGSEYTEGT